MKPVAARRLNSKVGRIRQEFINILEKLTKSHNVLDQLKRLETEAENKFNAKARKALEQLDKKITKLMMSAENKCRKIYLQRQ